MTIDGCFNSFDIEMNSQEYKVIISRISFMLLKERFPGIDKKILKEVGRKIAINIHARMYGANVDGVDSPIWTAACGSDRMNDPRVKPKIDAKEMLNEIFNCRCSP